MTDAEKKTFLRDIRPEGIGFCGFDRASASL